MKAVAINGSPRNGGNTEILLKKALAPLAAAGWETEFIQLGGVPIRGRRAVSTIEVGLQQVSSASRALVSACAAPKAFGLRRDLAASLIT